MGQSLAAIILVHMAVIKLTTYYGMFGIRALPMWFSYVFSVFTCVVITNAFNLIDGIDGLAASFGIVGAFTFGLWYHFLGMTQYTILCSALIGSLLAFLWFQQNTCQNSTESLILFFSQQLIEKVYHLPSLKRLQLAEHW